MEQLIRELHDPGNQAAPDRVHTIQRQIQLLQREKVAWQIGLDLLRHDEAIIRFYGALTLTIKINADWDNDQIGEDERMKYFLLETLVTRYLQLIILPDENFVIQKLCSTLVTLFTKLDSEWVFPLRHVLACLISGNYVSPASLPDMQQLCEAGTDCSDVQLKGILMLARTMAEDLGGRSSTSTVQGKVTDRTAANGPDAWQFFRFVLNAPATIGYHGVPAKASTELLQMVFGSIPFWASLIKHLIADADRAQILSTEALTQDCIRVGVEYFDHDRLTASVLQMLHSLQQSSARLLQNALPEYPSNIAESRKAKELVMALLSGDWTLDEGTYVDLLESIMSQVDTTTSEYLHSGRYTQVIETLRQLLRCEGIAYIEDPFCQVALEKISEMVEGFTDWDEGDSAQPYIQRLAADACDACLLKIQLPEEEMSTDTQEWDVDERAKFQDFRYDVHDFFQSAFAVLGNELIEGIVKSIVAQHEPLDWSLVEAATFAFTAFSDTMSSDPDTYDGLITAVLTSQSWRHLLQSGSAVPDRARQTSIRFIADNVVYLQRHPDGLALILNFLFSSLHLQASASAASRAIYSLCNSHREALTEGLPQFMDSLTTISDLGDAERHRIYAAVATIIQGLPTEEGRVQPLSELLSNISSGLAAVENAVADKTETLQSYTDIMQTLASIGKGLRSPNDTPIDLEASNAEQSTFWQHGPGAFIQRDVLALYRVILQKVGGDIDGAFVEACCDFIRSGFTEDHPSPFKFPDKIGLELVSALISLENPSIDTAMACASSFLASASSTNIQVYVSGILYVVISNQQRVLSIFQQSRQLPDTNFPPSSLDFLGRLITKWPSTWFSLPEGEQMAGVSIELGLALMADPDTLPRRSAASFFATLADCSGPTGSIDVETIRCMCNILQQYGPRILSLVLRLLGGECARSEIESLAETLKRFIQKQLMLTKAVLRDAVKQESGMMSEKALQATTLEERNRFLAQAVALRGGRKTNDIIKDFWIACRGSGFGYIA
ncbi:member of the karyopherin-beta [Elasticomyces elasticus]|uniref:Member of the karyopherin-beta n=1 Tax=Exophiala sideris TaxID=1016849 RepID=A0ABR0J8F6_9EURO|nr:member of the karyopherin-beta [Elasticomyces elasticus]KAK5022200.1 member of the karyopherin-beta [Exophiala sideris]KAK5037358.1 member of the karyopherin-beta [Exophiala sideris]KAK5059022.1 member of the karyopherin-beta [Exophiala sideris]KAK5182854.1 member of the karyopherin-beta [Eurotiomycetes sp. CCFEE 6388]